MQLGKPKLISKYQKQVYNTVKALRGSMLGWSILTLLDQYSIDIAVPEYRLAIEAGGVQQRLVLIKKPYAPTHHECTCGNLCRWSDTLCPQQPPALGRHGFETTCAGKERLDSDHRAVLRMECVMGKRAEYYIKLAAAGVKCRCGPGRQNRSTCQIPPVPAELPPIVHVDVRKDCGKSSPSGRDSVRPGVLEQVCLAGTCHWPQTWGCVCTSSC